MQLSGNAKRGLKRQNMAYSELIKNFNKIRDYMRDFYIYGFKSREEYTRKSARSYDDERRRLESWLGDYMQFRQTTDGKNVFISIDSRVTKHNPLYKAWKAKSFTDGDITLHFILIDILSRTNQALTLGDIVEQIDDYFSEFENPRMFDITTVRKKLKEYTKEGLVKTQKKGKSLEYFMADMDELPDMDILDFFSEVAPCGVIGSYLLDKSDSISDNFAFKHHYITSTMDSEVVYNIFLAMSEKRSITIESTNKNKDRLIENFVVPLKLMISVQSGRQYLMAYTPRYKRIDAYRTDNIVKVELDDVNDNFDTLREKLNNMMPHIWGVNTDSFSGGRMEHVEFTVHYDDSERHIIRRLEREKRCGKVEHIDNNTSKFSADIYDANEIVPWIRTFICRITDLSFSNKKLEEQFKYDMEKMYQMYGIEDGDLNDI